MRHSPLKWELISIAFIAILGGILHFVFELSGELPPVGVFAAVNESVFEHLKLTFWPTVLWGIAAFGLLRSGTNNYIIARAVSVYVMPITIIVLFYGYTTIFGIESLAIDIVIFVIAVAAGQLVGYRILITKKLPGWLSYLSGFMLVALGAVYGVLTIYPPHVPFFEDSATGTYGIS